MEPENESTLYIVMPTYNEADNIASVIEEWYPILTLYGQDSRLVIADGGSTDDTLSIIRELADFRPQLVALSYPGTDHGTKVRILYEYAIEMGADWIFQTDSDGQTSASEFVDFYLLSRSYDAVMGNRIVRGDGSRRKMVENVLRAYVKFFFDASVPDANAPFRLMRSSLVSKYMPLIPEGFNLPNAILAACFARYDENVIYQKVSFKPRQGGKNAMNYKLIFSIGLESINNFRLIKKSMRRYEGQLS